jgi:hypothetical protein
MPRYACPCIITTSWGDPLKLLNPFQYLSHDPEVVKDNENDPLIRQSASLRSVDDMLNRVWSFFLVKSPRLIQMLLRARTWLPRTTRTGLLRSQYDYSIGLDLCHANALQLLLVHGTEDMVYQFFVLYCRAFIT